MSIEANLPTSHEPHRESLDSRLEQLDHTRLELFSTTQAYLLNPSAQGSDDLVIEKATQIVSAVQLTTESILKGDVFSNEKKGKSIVTLLVYEDNQRVDYLRSIVPERFKRTFRKPDDEIWDNLVQTLSAQIDISDTDTIINGVTNTFCINLAGDLNRLRDAAMSQIDCYREIPRRVGSYSLSSRNRDECGYTQRKNYSEDPKCRKA